MIVALIALFVAMGGTGYAVTQLPRNSVGTTQIKNNAVTGSKVRDRSLSASDFAAESLPAGPAGPAGAPGAKGDKGDQGVPGVDATRYVYDANGEVVGDLIGVIEMNAYSGATLATRIDDRIWMLNADTGFTDGLVFYDNPSCTGTPLASYARVVPEPIVSDLFPVITVKRNGNWLAFEVSPNLYETLNPSTDIYVVGATYDCGGYDGTGSSTSYGRVTAASVPVPDIIPPLSIGP